MTAKQQKKPAAHSGKPVGSPSYWALSPMVSMVGMAGWIEMMKEGSSFVMERYGKDVEAQRRFMTCRSPEEVFRLQSEFLREAFEDYASGFHRIAGLWSKAMTLGFSEVTASRARNYDDIPL